MYCPSCGTQLSEAAKFCEKCGNPANAPVPPPLVQPVPKKQPVVRLKNIFILLLFFVVLGFVGLVIMEMISGRANRRSTASTPSVADTTSAPIVPSRTKSCLSVVGDNGEVDSMSTTVTGSVMNNCGKNFSYVQVTFKLFDVTGDVVGTALANQGGLSAGETWKFKAHALAPYVPSGSDHRFLRIRDETRHGSSSNHFERTGRSAG